MNKNDGGMKGALRTLDLFETFGREGRTLSLSQLAKLLNMPISSCHQLVATLEARGYLYTVGRRREIYPSGKILGVAQAIVAREDWLRAVTPHLQQLRDATRETIILGKRQGHSVIYLSIEEGPEPVRLTARVGDRKPLHVSAIGRALLADMEAPILGDMLLTLRNRYPKTWDGIDQADFIAALMRQRERGWFLQRGGSVADVTACSARFFIGEEGFAISVAGPAARIELSEARLVSRLLETRDAIQSMLDENIAFPLDGKTLAVSASTA